MDDPRGGARAQRVEPGEHTGDQGLRVRSQLRKWGHGLGGGVRGTVGEARVSEEPSRGWALGAADRTRSGVWPTGERAIQVRLGLRRVCSPRGP